jgi:hypothetical protein
MGCGKFFAQFSNKDLGFEIKDFDSNQRVLNIFKPNLN